MKLNEISQLKNKIIMKQKKFMAIAIVDVVGVHIPSQVKISKAFMVDENSIIEGVVIEGEYVDYAVSVLKKEFSVHAKPLELVSVGKKDSILIKDAKRIQQMLIDELEYRTPVRKFQSVLVQHQGITQYYVSKGSKIEI